MTENEVRDIVIKIIEDIAPDEDYENLVDSEPLRDQLGLDSMDFLDIVMELRKQYKIEVPEADYLELASMESTVKYLLPKF